MGVDVGNPGHGHAPGEIDDLGRRSLVRIHRSVIADRDVAAIANSNGARPGTLVIDGVDPTVAQDEVGEGFHCKATSRRPEQMARASNVMRCVFGLSISAPLITLASFLPFA